MRINLFDSRNTKVSDKPNSTEEETEVKVSRDNNYCRCCNRRATSIRLHSTNPSKSTGVTELLYIARVNKQDIVVCPSCVAEKPMLLHYNGKPVLVYDNATGKYRGDGDKIAQAKGTYEPEEGYF